MAETLSMYEEWLIDNQFDLDYPFGVPCEYWTCKDGKKIKIKDMSESHIKNCMNMVTERDPWYEHFYAELERRKAEEKEKQQEQRFAELYAQMEEIRRWVSSVENEVLNVQYRLGAHIRGEDDD